MTARRVQLSLGFTGLLVLGPLLVLAQGFLDLSQTQLKIREVQIIPRGHGVPCFSRTQGFGSIHARPGNKLLVVTLRGQVRTAGTLVFPHIGGFSIVYDDPQQPGEKHLLHVAALAFSEQEVLQVVEEEQFKSRAVRPGPLTIRLLTIAPEAVSKVRVVYPALVEGEASVGEKTL
jgi:hypothetical protein